MTDLVELSHYYTLADQLIEKASKNDIAETAKLLALNLAHYKMKYGELPLDETLAMLDIDKPSAEQTQMLVNGMEDFIGVPGNIVMGIGQERHWLKMSRRIHYYVYVIELSKDVLFEGKFKKCNPDYILGKPCVYVGMTGLNPDVRFDKHKAGIQSNRYVKQYGLQLLPDLYEGFNPMAYADASDKEVEIGIDLRSAGFGVWQA